MLEKLKQLNPSIPFFDISSKEFSEYGRVLADYNVTELTAEAKKIAYPESGSSYLPSVDAFETLDVANAIKDGVFGTLPIQMGYCFGHSNILNATEWHTSSEVNLAITPLVLILGKRTDIRDGKINSADMKAFYVPAGALIEVYATTLHFCPCQVSDEGFGCVVVLPLGTNVPLDYEVSDPLLFRKNKWIIAHKENQTLIDRGVVAGIYGVNYKINY